MQTPRKGTIWPSTVNVKVKGQVKVNIKYMTSRSLHMLSIKSVKVTMIKIKTNLNQSNNVTLSWASPGRGHKWRLILSTVYAMIAIKVYTHAKHQVCTR